ncbi:hypothetical protein F4556_000213 [Kitasatospora gansuensis]|uniref:Uncharacterized protein n=1 Tax=Kitasatospora gansuensis TaxID=258050 RepID=A0A7W7S7G0_9ACTN|nr:hypothetical protein [Kitasatospora gansuensis]MBB4944678.1 hypothetical protein [Kitasatospora gansuensis]
MNEQDTANFQRLLDRLAGYFEADHATVRSGDPLRTEQALPERQLTATADQAAATAAYSALPAP